MLQGYIQRYPSGLVDLFGLKAGETPSEIAERIYCMTDIRDQVMLGAREGFASAALAVAGNGNFVFPDMIVPAGEMWWVWGYNCNPTASLGAGQSIKYRSMCRTFSVFPTIFSDQVSVLALEFGGARSALDFWVQPGGQFGGVCEFIVAGPINFSGNVTFTRIRV